MIAGKAYFSLYTNFLSSIDNSMNENIIVMYAIVVNAIIDIITILGSLT